MKNVKTLAWLVMGFAFAFSFAGCSVEVESGEKYCSVIFNTNGQFEIPKQSVKENEKASAPQVPEITGYDFDGWYLGSEKYDFSMPVTKNIVLNAKWNLHQYKIIYDLSGGTNSINNPTTYTIEDEVTFEAPRKEGSDFSGWKFGNALITKITKGSTGDLTLTALWDVIFYEVILDAENGTEDKTFKVEHGKTFEKPENPEKTGYDFTGWVFDSETYDFSTPVTKSIKLTASWTLHEYKITYVLNEGTNAASNPASYTIEDKITFAEAKKESCTFSGWSNGSSIIEKIEAGTTGDLILTAIWDEIPVSEVILNKTKIELTAGETTELFATVLPENAHDKTITWKSSDTTIATVENGKVTALKKGNAVITATSGGKEATCEITIKPVLYQVKIIGGSVSLTTAEAGDKIEITAAAAETGYEFDKWIYTSSTGTSASSINIEENTATKTSFTMPESNVSISSSYKLINYQIVYKNVPEEVENKNPQSYNITTETFTLFEPERDKFTFEGWFENENLTGNAVAKIEKGTTGNKTLYAKWKPITSEVEVKVKNDKYGIIYMGKNNDCDMYGIQFDSEEQFTCTWLIDGKPATDFSWANTDGNILYINTNLLKEGESYCMSAFSIINGIPYSSEQTIKK